MGFFGIGTGEILLVLVLALIIWGPGRLPEIARTMGKMVRTLKKASFDLTTAVTKEIDEENKPPSQTKENPSTKPTEPLPDTGKVRAVRKADQPENIERHQQ